MGKESFEFIDKDPIEKFVVKRYVLKIYHQQAVYLNDFIQNTDFNFGKNNTYHPISNTYLQYEMSIEKVVANAADRVPVDGDAIRLVKNAFACCFEEARLSITGGSDIEHDKCCGQISTVMRAFTSKIGDFFLILIKLMNHQLKLLILL